jgi:hypothetical protein
MRYWLLSFLLLCLSASGAFAQLTIGFKAGGTIATVDETPTLADVREKGNVTGFSGGLFFEFGEGLMALRPEVLFQQRGYEYSLESFDSTFFERFNYLDLPVTLRLRFGKPKFRLFLEGGASLGFVLDGIRRVTANGNTVETDIPVDSFFGPDGRKPQSYELTGILGAGLEFQLGPGILTFNGRYNLDLTDIYEFEDDQAPPEWENTRWRSFDFTVGYGFRLGFL